MDEKKYIKYTIETINDKDDLELGKSFKEMVMEAVKHALKEGIKANSIIINKDFVRVKKSWINNGFSYSELPDMICGLECYLTDTDLPENYSFAVVEKPQTERKRLIEKIKSDTSKEIFEKLLGYIGSRQQFCIVDEEHKTLIDCDKLFDFVGNLAKEKYGVDFGE